MKILKMYVGEPNFWEETTLEETLHFTEERGYWKKGTVKQMLEDGAVIRTPFAFYKKVEEGEA